MKNSEAYRFFPSTGPNDEAERIGFRFGNRGTHSSRTIMLTELTALLAATRSEKDRSGYAAAIVEENCLGKATASTRRLSNQRLGELYALDPRCAVFRVLRRLWDLDPSGRPLLAMLAALARDPLFLASAPPILALPEKAEMMRVPMKDAIREVTGNRMNDAVLDKVVRNVASSWTQAGHLEGRTFKFRRIVRATPPALAFAVFLGHIAGFRGEDLLASGWVSSLDCSPSSAQGLAFDAKRAGLIELRTAGGVVQFGFDKLDPGPGRR